MIHMFFVCLLFVCCVFGDDVFDAFHEKKKLYFLLRAFRKKFSRKYIADR